MVQRVNQPSGPLSPEARQNLFRNRLARGARNAGLNINLTPEIVSSVMSRFGGVMPGQNAINNLFASPTPKIGGPMMPRPITNMGPGMGLAPMQGQMPQYMNDPRLLEMPMTQNDLQATLARQNAMQNPPTTAVGMMPPPPTFGFANPQNPYVAYLQQVSNQGQIGAMNPGMGMAPTQTGLGAQGTLVPPGMGVQQFPPSGMQGGMDSSIRTQLRQSMPSINNPQFRGLLG